MNYLRIYSELCRRGQDRTLIGYKETHHIVPRCSGGGDEAGNLVGLTAREHFIAHRLLVKIYPDNNKLKFALFAMTRKSKDQDRKLSSRQYEAAKNELAIALSALHKTRYRSPESAKKLSIAMKNRIISAETRAKQSRNRKGRPSPTKGTKRPGIGGRKKGFKGKYQGTAASRAKQAASLKKSLQPSANNKGYEILTPSGWQSFAGVSYNGMVPCLKFTAGSEQIIVSKKHRFVGDKLASEYLVGELLETSSGRREITSIEEVGRKPVFDVLNVDGGHLYYANEIVNHNCEFVTDADLAIIPEWDDKYVQDIPRDEFYNYYHKYVGMDLGVKDLTADIFGYYDFKRAALIIEDEFSMSGPSMNTELLVGAIRAKEIELWNNKENPKDANGVSIPFRRVSDNNWPIMMLDFSALHNLTFIETNKDNLEAMINEVRLMVQAGQIIIHPRCKQLIGCLKYGVWDSKKKKFAQSKTYGHFDHLAALVYLVRNLSKGTNPIPINHGFENHKAWLGNIKDQMGTSKNARTISTALTPKPATFNTLKRHRGHK